MIPVGSDPIILLFLLWPQVKKLFIWFSQVLIVPSTDINVTDEHLESSYQPSGHLYCQFHSSSHEQVGMK